MHQVKVALAAALAALALPAVAQAQPTIVVEGAPTVRVGYADLNLANPAGLARLNARVRSAAAMLCTASGAQPLRQAMAGAKCRDEAVADAHDQIDAAVANFGTVNLAALSQIAVAIGRP